MNEEWRVAAACRYVDPELFFPPSAEYASTALSVCRRCPARQACLDYALEAEIRDGVWGGKTREQRARILNGTKNHNAFKTHCKNNHPFDEANTYIRPNTGTRMCRTCQRASEARWRQRREAVSA